MSFFGDPILSTAEAANFEARHFAQNEEKEWAAIQRAGQTVAEAVLRDFEEIGGFPKNGAMLVLVGKGHNGADALLAARRLLTQFPAARATLILPFGVKAFRPLALRAFHGLINGLGSRVTVAPAERLGSAYDLCLDGVFGFQFRPPAEAAVSHLAARIDAVPIRLRAAVDLPSAGLFRADFTYATGSVKTPVLDNPAAGRVRYLDLGFFRGDELGAERALKPRLLAPLAGLRSPQTDKRTYGHVFILGGSHAYPGAVLMAVLAALRSGVGLVTAFVPESLAPQFAARAPEAMWVGWPETPEGSLALEGQSLLRACWERATAIVIGPGIGREAETLALLRDIVKTSPVPVLLDADALQAEIVAAATAPGSLVLTPHAGEFARIAGRQSLREFSVRTGAVVALKGAVTRVCGGREVHHNFLGGPVLARGGSGDLLAGLIGGLLAQTPAEPLQAACRGVVWHGLAADLLARAHGQTAVNITQLLDFLPAALRESTHE